MKKLFVILILLLTFSFAFAENTNDCNDKVLSFFSKGNCLVIKKQKLNYKIYRNKNIVKEILVYDNKITVLFTDSKSDFEHSSYDIELDENNNFIIKEK